MSDQPPKPPPQQPGSSDMAIMVCGTLGAGAFLILNQATNGTVPGGAIGGAIGGVLGGIVGLAINWLLIRSGPSQKSLDAVVENLFGPTASVRRTAYKELMARFSKSPELVSRLLDYAVGHIDNQNGVYNTLVVLSYLDHRALRSDLASIRAFADKARAIGPKTSERADKLLEKLSRLDTPRPTNKD